MLAFRHPGPRTHPLLGHECVYERISLQDGVGEQRRQGPFESATPPLEEEFVRREVVTRDLDPFRREGGQEAERVPFREALDEPDEIGVASLDRGALVGVNDGPDVVLDERPPLHVALEDDLNPFERRQFPVVTLDGGSVCESARVGRCSRTRCRRLSSGRSCSGDVVKAVTCGG